MVALSEIGPSWPLGLGERVFHIAFSVLTRPPCTQIAQEAGPAWETLKVPEFGPALNKISTLGPNSKSGVPLENPFAETRRPYQIWGLPTQKGEASIKFGSGAFDGSRRPILSFFWNLSILLRITVPSFRSSYIIDRNKIQKNVLGRNFCRVRGAAQAGWIKRSGSTSPPPRSPDRSPGRSDKRRVYPIDLFRPIRTFP